MQWTRFTQTEKLNCVCKAFIAGHLQGHLINFYDQSTIFGNKSSNINFLLNGHI